MFFLGFMLIYFQQKATHSYVSIESTRTAALGYNLLNQSLLSLHKSGKDSFPNFGEELQLHAFNSRPDAKQLEKEMGQPRFILAFRGHLMPLALCSGQPIYFAAERALLSPNQSWNGPPAPLVISNTPTSWKITPIALEDRVFIEVENDKVKSELLLQEDASRSTSFHERALESGWYKALKSAKFWTADRFSSTFGEPKENLLKIGLGISNADNIVACSVGDYLFYASGQWQAGQLAFAKGRPLAKILAADTSGVSVGVWDETGFFCQTMRIDPINITNYTFIKPETIFSSLKQRNNSEVSCIMGKRRVVLKTGTWWIKSQRGWRRLKNRAEIDDYRSYRLLGELIIIDGLETFQGRSVIKGRLIDPLRLFIEPFSLQVPESLRRMNIPHPPVVTEKTPTEKNHLKPQQVLKSRREAPSQ